MNVSNLLGWLKELQGLEAGFCDWLQFIETYIYADWQFLNFLLVLVVVNSVLGLYVQYHKRSLSKKLINLWLQKILIYSCYLILVHIISHFTIEGEKNQYFGWFNGIANSALIIRESIYILENMGTIRSGLIPQWMLKKLKKYDRDGCFPFGEPEEKRNKLSVRQ
jgi:phage-related holin